MAADNSFSIGGIEFKFRKLDVFKQFHVARKIAPLLADILPAMKKVKDLSDKPEISESEKFDQFAELAQPFVAGLAKLPDAESEKLLKTLLSSVDIKDGLGVWSAVSTESMIMHQNLELPVLLQLAGKAFMHNLSGFFAALPRQ